MLSPAPAGLAPAAWQTAAVAAWMAIWWIAEPLPLPATALLPLVLFPLFGIGTIREAATPFASPVVYLFLGGFLIAAAMQKANLHRRIALGIIRAASARTGALIPGFMVATAFISMWVSNTAATIMMLPIAMAVAGIVLAEADGDSPDARNFSGALVLGIAYASSIGGVATLIGTPPNAILAAHLADSYGIQIGFGRWLMFGLPVSGLMLPLAWWVLCRRTYPQRLATSPAARDHIAAEWRALGPVSAVERRVAAVFGLAAFLWILRPQLATLPGLGGLSDGGIAIFCGLLPFLPGSGKGAGKPILSWDDAEKLPWGILVLIGGGLSLAAAIARNGLATAIGQGLASQGHLAPFVAILAVVTIVLFLTELTSNTATAAAFIPIMAGLAVVLGESPLALAAPAAVAASCAFMLPVATAPNAIIYSSGFVTVGQMVRAGIWLNLIGIGLISVLSWLLLPVIVG